MYRYLAVLPDPGQCIEVGLVEILGTILYCATVCMCVCCACRAAYSCALCVATFTLQLIYQTF